MQKRFVLWWLLLFLLVYSTFLTQTINIAIVSMVNSPDIEITPNKSQTAICPNTTFWLRESFESDNGTSTSVSQNSGYDWSEAEQNMVLSAFYWLNYLSIMPGGFLAHKYGSKKVVGYSQLISSAMSSLIPLMADYGPLTVSCIRALQGVLLYMAVPAGYYSIVGNWSPPHERSKFGAHYPIGTSVGSMVGSILFGYIGQYLHWTMIFHFTSICGIIWSILWFLFAYNSPAQHPSISLEELNYIESSLKYSNDETKTSIPWKDIIASVPLLACVLAMSSTTWAWVAVNTYSPTYLKTFYGLNSNEIGIVTSLPNIAIGILSIGLGYISDLIIRKSLLTMTTVRKIFVFIGGIVSGIPLLLIAFTKCNLILIISCLMINNVTNAFDMFGSILVVVDLSPKFCGILQGVTGSVSLLLTFVFSSAMSYFTLICDIETLWTLVFIFTASYGIISCGIYLIFGTSKVQNWNFEKHLDSGQTSMIERKRVP